MCEACDLTSQRFLTEQVFHDEKTHKSGEERGVHTLRRKVSGRDRTALRHMRTVEKASERVSSWPSWKRDVTFFRDSDEEEPRT